MKRNRLTILFIFPLLFFSCKKENSGRDMTDNLIGKWKLTIYETTFSVGGKNENSSIQTDKLPYKYLSFDGPDSASLWLTIPYFIGSDGSPSVIEWNPTGADVSIKDGSPQSRKPVYFRKYYYRLNEGRLLLKETNTFNPSAWVVKWGEATTGIVDSLVNYYPELRDDINWWNISVDGNLLKLKQEISYGVGDNFRSTVTMVFSRE
ncbi:MAG: hypothetical protein LBV59_24145 [Sphingobacterium sp.]|uniref:hypothetical protein n=1 Tax=Sphingobacterium sp. TaxID=341027 RepID=UPI002847697D|nr:hypothetical protein [Sphingobacterium sp.]MDR3011039.1 hypothetical protein [Sphingobacterium sp.]